MTLTIHITRKVQDGPHTYSATKTETVVDLQNVDLGSESLTANYLRALAETIDPPKDKFSGGGTITNFHGIQP